MDSNLINIGIIGTGFIADLHMEALGKLKNARVLCCCDIDAARAKSFARRYNLKSYYTDLSELVTSEKLDVAHVLVPPNFHFSVSKRLIENGINIFLEKPMGPTSQECDTLNDIGNRNGVKIGVNHNFIYYPLFQKLKQDLLKNKIGKPEYVAAYYGGPLGQVDFNQFGNWMFQKPGNIILEQAPHPISQVISVLGNIQHITATATGKRELGKGQFFYDRWQALAECKKGNAFIHLSFGKNYSNQRNLHVFGRDGSIYIDFLNNQYLVQKKSILPDYLDPTANSLRYLSPVFSGIKDFTDYAISKVNLKDRSDSFFLTMKNSVDAFYNAMSNNDPLPSCGEDVVKIIRACEKWIEAVGIQNDPVTITAMPKPQDDDEVLVTGATGFIGRRLVEKLIEQDKKVRIIVRSLNGLPHSLYSDNVRIMLGDITNEECVEQAVKGIKIVYHLAHGLGKTWDDFYRLNVKPADFFAEACLREKARYVFSSTIAAFYYGDIPGGIVKHDSPIDSKPELRNLYARSKIVIENKLMDIHKEKGLKVVIVRPGIVVGNGGILEHSGVGLWTRDNVCAFWGSGKNELPFVLVEDTADALVHMFDKRKIEGKSFNLVGDVRLNAIEYIDALKKYSKRNIFSFAYPIKVLYISDVMKMLIKKIGGDQNIFLSYRDLVNRSINGEFDTIFEKQTLHWEPVRNPKIFLENVFLS